MEKNNYMPDHLRAAYCQIQDLTPELKRLKKIIGEELVKSEEKILKMFPDYNKEFVGISNL